MATEITPFSVELPTVKHGSKIQFASVSAPKAMPKYKKLEPLLALEPARKKLTAIESQRIMACLDDTTKRIELAMILPQTLSNIDRFSVVLGADLVVLLKQHKVLKESYEENIRKIEKIQGIRSTQEEEIDEDFFTRPRSKPSTTSESERPGSGSVKSVSSTASESQLESLMKAQQFLGEEINSSIRNILRGFSRNPVAITTLKNEFNPRGRTVKGLLGGLSGLRGIMMEKLLTTPLEAQEKMQYLKQISLRERQNAIVIEKLEAELNAALADKDEEVTKKNDVIRKLQGDLHQIEKFSEEHIKRTRAEAEKQETSDIKNSEGKRQKLQADVTQLKTQLQNLMAENRDNEINMRQKKLRIETEIENWIQKFDTDMGSRQDEYEEVDAIYTEEKKQLHELEEKFKTLEIEYNQIMEERRIAEEKRLAAEAEMQLMIKASITVQAFWRSYKVRKALKGKKKKGKGKGKGKGKKK